MTTLILIMQLFPLVVSAIQQIEATAPVAKAGAAKLALVIQAVTTAYRAANFDNTLIPQATLISVIGSIANDVVAFYNTVGIFKKSS